MSIKQDYNEWASQYDNNENKTRDLEAIALKNSLQEIDFDTCLEVGCGTGKNTAWLMQKSTALTSVDFSEEMLAKAKQKINAAHVRFEQADINKPWTFAGSLQYHLITCSLVLEHIENLDFIFQQAAAVLKPGGHIYIGELHPFKKYSGSMARFETAAGTRQLKCYTHHVSDFVNAAKANGLTIKNVLEYFDEDNKSTIPRLLILLFKKI